MGLLAFDYGRRRIGVAVGEELTGSARGLRTFASDAPDLWSGIDTLVAEWAPEGFVVGWPTQADGKPTPLARRIRGFARTLEERYGQPVYWSDEHLTSHLARERRRPGRHDPGLDAHAAAVILEGWFLENAS
ncbi:MULTISPECIES: Holliday junction resolvase RuvX [unclassified Thioalkalivibrio]|uniref:Holliday junction resolvase RuvX n=1 Tax=unclassified Thioalkalivibrio TaxID=2621013 RepID=UPI00036B0897|nr:MULTISPECIES: Holliday junction resolvase RuvX [unclassified Thioalkalivibrio]